MLGRGFVRRRPVPRSSHHSRPPRASPSGGKFWHYSHLPAIQKCYAALEGADAVAALPHAELASGRPEEPAARPRLKYACPLIYGKSPLPRGVSSSWPVGMDAAFQWAVVRTAVLQGRQISVWHSRNNSHFRRLCFLKSEHLQPCHTSGRVRSIAEIGWRPPWLLSAKSGGGRPPELHGRPWVGWVHIDRTPRHRETCPVGRPRGAGRVARRPAYRE